MTTRHGFTEKIEAILKQHFGEFAQEIFEASPLLGYLNQKTRSANRGSKARGAFANHYALYVLVEDYIDKGYAPGGANHGRYSDYDGARFSDLFRRQRELPFGKKLQNHALNSRLNDEFKKFYPLVDKQPIVRDVASQRYWLQESLLNVVIRDKSGKRRTFSLAKSIIDIVEAYVETKREAFHAFIDTCKEIAILPAEDLRSVVRFIEEQLQPNVDARVFEIVSFAVLKAYYGEKVVFWGWSRDEVNPEALTLYKTGRTNANDGGIDFVMKPLGRFFQVTETVDVHKYFLDIDKIQRFPLTFVVKSHAGAEAILSSIREQAEAKYQIKAVVEGYMQAVEEVINIPVLLQRLGEVVQANKATEVMSEIVRQSKVEFNYEEDDLDSAVADVDDSIDE